MDEATVIRRLEALEPPDLRAARQRAATVAAARVGTRASAHRPPLSRRAVAIASTLCAFLVAFSLLTTPGQAVTSWVGNRLGLGQPGEHPTLRQLRHSWSAGTAAQGQPAYVLATGPAPRGTRYEFITYEPKAPPGKHWDVKGPCFELDLTQARSMTTGGCGVFPEGPDLFATYGGNGAPGQELLEASGRASMAVASVDVTLGNRKIPAELTTIPAGLVSRLQLPQRFKFFVAFLPGKLSGGTLTVKARDAKGHLVAERQLEVPNLSPPAAHDLAARICALSRHSCPER